MTQKTGNITWIFTSLGHRFKCNPRLDPQCLKCLLTHWNPDAIYSTQVLKRYGWRGEKKDIQKKVQGNPRELGHPTGNCSHSSIEKYLFFSIE